jgi:hypothetical protein
MLLLVPVSLQNWERTGPSHCGSDVSSGLGSVCEGVSASLHSTYMDTCSYMNQDDSMNSYVTRQVMSERGPEGGH